MSVRRTGRGWRVRSSEVVYEGAVRLVDECVRDPAGAESDFCRIDAKDGVAILAIDAARRGR